MDFLIQWKLLQNYENHPSIIAITEKFSFTGHFEFEEVNLKDIEKEILNLNSKKAFASNSIPAEVLKERLTSAALCFSRYGMMKFLKSVSFQKILNQLTLLLFKKEEKNLAKNYRPVSVLPTLSKVLPKASYKSCQYFLVPISLWLQKRVQYPIRSFVITRKMGKGH